MKIIPVDLAEFYKKFLDESSPCVCLYVPEELRIEIREKLRQELIRARKLEDKLEDKKSTDIIRKGS